MQETKKSVAKRFKSTSRDNLIQMPGFWHLLEAKSILAKPRATRDKLIVHVDALALNQCLAVHR